MKHIFLVLLTAIQFVAFGQGKEVKFNLPADIVTESRLTQKIDSLAKALNGSVKPNPEPELPKCDRGPTISAISQVTSTGLTLLFDANNVFGIAYKVVRENGTTFFVDSIRPGSNTVILPFKVPLNNGNYRLKLWGKSCKSDTSNAVTFAVKTDTGDGGTVIPPPVPDKPGKYNLETVAKGFDDHLKLSIRDSADVRLVSDVSTEGRGDNYNYRYLIGSDMITQKNRLNNYIVAGNNPLRVLKMKLKNGLESINKWGTGNEDYSPGSYWQMDAGESFSHNTSYAFNTFVTRGPQDQAGFLNHVPQSYEPSRQVTQYQDIAPDMTLPKGHVWIARPTKPDAMQVIRKGVTHLPHHFLPWDNAGNKEVTRLKDAGLTYNNVPRLEVIFNLSRTGADNWVGDFNTAYWPLPEARDSEQWAIDKANQADISDVIWIGETQEGSSWVTPSNPLWGRFYKQLRKRYEDKWASRGFTYYICHNYFTFWPGNLSLGNGREKDKALLRLPANQLPHSDFSPDGQLTNTNLIVEGVYLNAPDIVTGQVYKLIFSSVVKKTLGYETGVFLFGVHETRPNNKYEYKYNEGTFYHEDKIPIDPNVHIANVFIAHTFGKLFTEWGDKGYFQNRYFKVGTDGVWFNALSNDQQQRFPINNPGYDGYYGYSGSMDLTYFGHKLWNDTFGKTVGGERKFLKHRIDNGPWITPSGFSVDEVVDAYHDSRGFALAETKSGKTAWFYLNSFADNKWHTLSVELPNGQIVSQKVAGNGIHAKIQ